MNKSEKKLAEISEGFGQKIWLTKDSVVFALRWNQDHDTASFVVQVHPFPKFDPEVAREYAKTAKGN
jgi:hypothetical protein